MIFRVVLPLLSLLGAPGPQRLWQHDAVNHFKNEITHRKSVTRCLSYRTVCCSFRPEQVLDWVHVAVRHAVQSDPLDDL